MRRTLFDEDHEAFRQSFRKFADAEIVPHLAAWEQDGIVPRDLFRPLAAGFLGMAIAEEFGGGGVRDFRFNAVLAEELMRAGQAGAGLALTLHNDICLPYFLDYCTGAEAALAAGHRLRRADHGDRDDRAGHRLRSGAR